MVVLIVVGVVVLLMIIALPFAKRRDARKGHANRSIGDINATMRTQRLQLRESRRLHHPDRPRQERRAGRKSN